MDPRSPSIGSAAVCQSGRQGGALPRRSGHGRPGRAPAPNHLEAPTLRGRPLSGPRAWLQAVRQEGRDFRDTVDRAPAPPVRVPRLLVFPWRLSWALFHEHTEPRRLGAAVAVGVFIGATPLYGLHLALCILVGLALRLNKLAMWIGANVSMPFLAPFLAFACVQVAHRLLHGEWSAVRVDELSVGAAELGRFWLYWLIGAPFVGTVLGLILGGLVWLIASRRPTAPGA